MNNFKIGTRLNVAFGSILLLLIAITSIGWSSLSATKTSMDVVVYENNTKIALSNKMLLDLNLVARSVRNYILYKDKEKLATMLERIDRGTKGFSTNVEKLGVLVKSEQAKKIYADIQTHAPETLRRLNHVVSLVNDGKSEEATLLLMNQVQPLQDSLFADLYAMVDLQEKQNQMQIDVVHDEYLFSIRLLIGASGLATLVGAGLAFAIRRSITVPIDQAVSIADTIAGGDLSRDISVSGKDEVSQLLYALNEMRSNLASIVTQVRSGTDTISTASQQIAAGNQDLSSRTEHQASSLEETASSMEELTSTVNQNAESVRQANELAKTASEVAVRGADVVSQVVTTMEAINESSAKIVNIIGVIDGIAFQTNILALNAAVEAARAGEQGRGFAVVASEVRILAQRCTEAAKEIKQLIGVSVEKVEMGTSLVTQAGNTIVDITDSIKHVNDIMSEINLASQEQQAGIHQINEAVIQMDQVTQQNAALVEEAEAAATSLQQQAVSLAKLVNTFTLSAEHGYQAKSASSTASNRPVRLTTALTSRSLVKNNSYKPVAASQSSQASQASKRVANAYNEEWDEF